MQNEEVTVIARKYDLSIRRSWKCRFVDRNESLLTLVGEFAETVDHPDLGAVEKGTISHEYFWLDRWYNVFRFHTPTGDLRNFYCNISRPPTFENGILDYVDLDIDLIVWPDVRVVTLDLEDFDVNTIKYGYPAAVRQNALDSLERLKKLVESREFPFDVL